MSIERQNQYLYFLIGPIFQAFVLSFEDKAHQTRHIGHFLSKVEIKGYNVVIDGQL